MELDLWQAMKFGPSFDLKFVPKSYVNFILRYIQVPPSDFEAK